MTDNEERLQYRMELNATSQEMLDEAVFDAFMHLVGINQLDEDLSEEEVEELYSEAEAGASAVLNEGRDAQIEWLLDFEFEEVF